MVVFLKRYSMEDQNFLDSILIEIDGFGRYQKIISALISYVAVITYFGTVIFAFETKQVNHRCEITGCESNPFEFQPSWWTYAIPEENGKPSKCSKFLRCSNETDTCDPSDFNKGVVETCENFVYESAEVSILHDFNLQCEDNIWKLTLVGTLHGAGQFIGLPLSGVLSDRFGRKTALVFTMVSSGIIGIVRSFSTSYLMFMVLGIMESVFRAGCYATAFILGLELVGSEHRRLISVLISSMNAFGGVIHGGIAWLLQSWRALLRVLYATYVLVFFFYWLLPESVRWLLAKNRVCEAQDILSKIAKVNGRILSDERLIEMELYTTNQENTKKNSILELFRSQVLMVRLVICSVCWVCAIFLYNGLTINAVDLLGNSYLDFILTNVVEIPGCVIAYFTMNTLGRNISSVSGYLLTGIACIISIFIPAEMYWLRLILYLIGKFGISISMVVIYASTGEVFPTPFRNSLLAACSMVGRIGIMIGPQMPLLETIWKPLPFTLFGSAGVLAAILTLFLPETMNTNLPNTIQEAIDIGK